MNPFNKKFLIPALILLLIDITWLSTVMSRGYHPMIKTIQGSTMKMNYYYGAAAYLCVLILLYIIIKNNLSLIEAFLIGLAGWGLYDFTAGAVLKDWSLSLSILDILWGGLLLMSMKYISDKL
jgi:uncharacterized membrane protein